MRGRAPILPLGIATVGTAQWEITIYPSLPTPQNADAGAAAMNEALEQVISHSPADWFWVHNRWKTPKPNFLLQGYKRGITLPDSISMSDLKPFEILVRSPNWLGDACMAVPAVRAMRRGRPDSRITVLAPAKLADVWRCVPEVADVIEIPNKAGIFKVRSLLKQAAVHYDVAVLLPNSLRSALEVWRIIPRLVGYAGHARRKLLDQIIPPADHTTAPRPHHTQHYLRIALRMGGNVEQADLFAPVFPDTRYPEKLRLGLCAGAEYGPAKRYPAEQFAKAATLVAEQVDAHWVLFGAAGDQEISRQVEKGLLAGQVTNLAGKTTLTQLVQQLRSCQLLLSNDTGTMHLAALLGVPTISIFGSTDPTWTAPLGANHVVLRRHVECSPCFLRECPLDFRCMNEIPPEVVAQAVLQAVQSGTGMADA
jgi:lipopolysaccharide heptosyltransferase II